VSNREGCGNPDWMDNLEMRIESLECWRDKLEDDNKHILVRAEKSDIIITQLSSRMDKQDISLEKQNDKLDKQNEKLDKMIIKLQQGFIGILFAVLVSIGKFVFDLITK